LSVNDFNPNGITIIGNPENKGTLTLTCLQLDRSTSSPIPISNHARREEDRKSENRRQPFLPSLRALATTTVRRPHNIIMGSQSPTTSTTTAQRWKLVGGATLESLALFRIGLGLLLTLELVQRFRYLHPFYSDEGTLPLRLLLPKVDDLYQTVCLHCHFGQEGEQQILLALQVGLAALLTVGVATFWTALLSWYLYLSLTLRNTWMNYILDRYFHYLLFLAIFLPLGERFALLGPRRSDAPQPRGAKQPPGTLVVSPATVALKVLVLWIYLDAGGGKWMDPLGGWTYHADPLPAMDTYARHTLSAQYLYALLGPPGLRLLTPVVVYIELLAGPLAVLGAVLSSRTLVFVAVTLICALHVGIAMTLRNAALLSLIACVPWSVFLPLGLSQNSFQMPSRAVTRYPSKRFALVSLLCIGALAGGSLWFATLSQACDQSVRHIWSTLLHNRWNVFVGAEEYVSWEIAPGLLADGSVVDVWSKSLDVRWSMPGSGAPSTSSARPGRWRSFPYLAELEGDEGEALWSYLCGEWDRENHVDLYPDRRLVRYNFFMLQANVLPNMMFSATRKRLIKEYECMPQVAEEDVSGDRESPATGDEKEKEGSEL
jgi:hypothetical protein